MELQPPSLLCGDEQCPSSSFKLLQSGHIKENSWACLGTLSQYLHKTQYIKLLISLKVFFLISGWLPVYELSLHFKNWNLAKNQNSGPKAFSQSVAHLINTSASIYQMSPRCQTCAVSGMMTNASVRSFDSYSEGFYCSGGEIRET